jgi:hypothetical protein
MVAIDRTKAAVLFQLRKAGGKSGKLFSIGARGGMPPAARLRLETRTNAVIRAARMGRLSLQHAGQLIGLKDFAVAAILFEISQALIEGMNVLADILVHAMADALDHGYLKPLARGQKVGAFCDSSSGGTAGRPCPGPIGGRAGL